MYLCMYVSLYVAAGPIVDIFWQIELLMILLNYQ